MQQQRELTRNPYKKDKRAKDLGLVFAVAAFFCLLFWAYKKVRRSLNEYKLEIS
jgi:ferric-dicitrate binding protein FerR (iron transport regulator)